MAARTTAAAAGWGLLSSWLEKVPANSSTSKAAGRASARPMRGSTPAWPRQALA